MWVQLPTTCSNLLKQPNEELLVAVNHNQLRTMASETVDTIDWSHPHPAQGSAPWAPCIAHCNVGWAANHKSCCTESAANVRPSECQTNALPVRPLRVFSVDLDITVLMIRYNNNNYNNNWTSSSTLFCCRNHIHLQQLPNMKFWTKTSVSQILKINRFINYDSQCSVNFIPLESHWSGLMWSST